MTTFSGAWHNSYAVIQTTYGTWRAAYHPRKDGSPDSERILIANPDDTISRLHCPSLGGFGLTVEDGLLCVWWVEAGTLVEHRDSTNIACGQPVAAHTFGGVGPIGPAGAEGPRGEDGPQGVPGAPGRDGKDAQVSEDHMRQIAALTAEAVLLGGPAGDHYGLAPNAQFGTRLQETVAVMFTNQAFWQEVIKAIDTAALGLQSGGYTPKVQGG
jgi:hypothetical protein